jgi:hypothetical protein
MVYPVVVWRVDGVSDCDRDVTCPLTRSVSGPEIVCVIVLLVVEENVGNSIPRLVALASDSFSFELRDLSFR